MLILEKIFSVIGIIGFFLAMVAFTIGFYPTNFGGLIVIAGWLIWISIMVQDFDREFNDREFNRKIQNKIKDNNEKN